MEVIKNILQNHGFDTRLQNGKIQVLEILINTQTKEIKSSWVTIETKQQALFWLGY